MSIHKLPDYVINRLKAWEVVEKPASILKELVENSLDAGATCIEIGVNDGGKSYLSVQDDGSGIELSDMDLVLERYATSKIQTDEDLYRLSSYGFRGEALASIAEVSKTTLLTKTPYAEIGTKLVKKWGELILRNQPVGFEHGTLVSVEDLFYNVPARLKFLKSAQTEFFYCYNYFVDVALWHFDKAWILKKNDKVSFDLQPTRDLKERIVDLYKKDWRKNLKDFSVDYEYVTLKGVVSDASLRFGSMENIKIYVNGRPVQDKIIRKALMDAYNRQLTPGEYPFVVLMLDIDPKMVDVNVHPAKLQVKFADSKMIYQVVYDTISASLWENKIAQQYFNYSSKSYRPSEQTSKALDSFVAETSSSITWPLPFSGEKTSVEKLFAFEQATESGTKHVTPIFGLDSLTEWSETPNSFFHQEIWEYQVLGQLWNSYIVLQSQDALYYIDQHALAERISFETMKKEQNLKSELLLQPLKFEITQIPNLETKIEELNQLWFDISMLGGNVIVIYAIPQIFVTHPVDIQTLFNHVFYLEEISFDHLMDGVYASKACKTSIKAWHRLSLLQMEQLVMDGFEKIPGLFVCQHGRPFFVRIDKNNIDKMFDR